jgi:hypothetical protein
MVSAQAQIGLFANHTDVGTVLQAGSVDYDAFTRRYTISGSGENMWFASDDFQFVWTKMSGDVRLSATVSILDKEGDAHRKAVLMIRQSLDPDAAYADAALHGDGLTSLQFREEKGAVTHELESNVSAPRRLRIEKRGDSFYLWIGGEAGGFRFAGGSMRVPLHEPFYVGIGVCAHNKDELRKAVFSDVELTTPSPAGNPAPWSTLETVTVASTDAHVAYAAPGHISPPGWSADGRSLLFQSGGKLETVPLTGGQPAPYPGTAPPGIATGSIQLLERATSGQRNKTPPVLTMDGKKAAFLTWEDGDSEVTLRVLSLDDQRLTTLCRYTGGHDDLPSWSPDGLRLAFVSYQLIQ